MATINLSTGLTGFRYSRITLAIHSLAGPPTTISAFRRLELRPERASGDDESDTTLPAHKLMKNVSFIQSVVPISLSKPNNSNLVTYARTQR